jgi:uncharacterized protein YecE (DUF72 family)
VPGNKFKPAVRSIFDDTCRHLRWSTTTGPGRSIRPACRSSRWLGYYAKFFRTTEINSTYHVPAPASCRRIRRPWRSGALSTAESEKVTHDSADGPADRAGLRGEGVGADEVGGRAGAVLPALPASNPEHLDRLSLSRRLDTKAYDYAVELRHRSWIREYGPELKPLFEIRRRAVQSTGPDAPFFRVPAAIPPCS